MKFYIYTDVPHTHPDRRGFFPEEKARLSKKSDSETAHRVLQDQEEEFRSRRRIASWVSRSGSIVEVAVESIPVRSGRLPAVSPEEINRLAAWTPKRSIESCLAASGIEEEVVAEDEEAHVGWCGVPPCFKGMP